MNIALQFIRNYGVPAPIQPVSDQLNEKYLSDDENFQLDDKELDKMLQEYLNSKGLLQRKIDSLIEFNTLLNLVNEKLEQKIAQYKIIMENWTGVDSFKQMEKLEHQIMDNLRQIKKLQEHAKQSAQTEIHRVIFDTDFNREHSIYQLLLFCDNLDINCMVYSILMEIIRRNSDGEIYNTSLHTDAIYNDNNIVYKLLYHFNKYFLINIRQHYPRAVELFKTEKFYKDTGASKPESMEAPSDKVNINGNKIKIAIQSIKKEQGDQFHAYIFLKTHLNKQSISLDFFEEEFLYSLFTLRISNKFYTLKQRAGCYLIMQTVKNLSNCKIWVGEAQSNLKCYNEWKHMLAIRQQFPLQDYLVQYKELQGQMFLFYKVDKESLDQEIQNLEVEKLALQNIYQNLLDNFGNQQEIQDDQEQQEVKKMSVREFSAEIQFLPNFLVILSSLQKKIQNMENHLQLQEDFKTICQSVSDILNFILDKYFQTSENPEEDQQIRNVIISFLMEKLFFFAHDILGKDSDEGMLGAENQTTIKEKILKILQKLSESSENLDEFDTIQFPLSEQLFKNVKFYSKEFVEQNFFQNALQNCQNDSKNQNLKRLFVDIIAKCDFTETFKFSSEQETEKSFKILDTTICILTKQNCVFQTDFNECLSDDLFQKLYKIYETITQKQKDKQLTLNENQQQILDQLVEYIGLGITLQFLVRRYNLDIKADKKKKLYEPLKENFIKTFIKNLQDYSKNIVEKDNHLEKLALERNQQINNTYNKIYLKNILHTNSLKRDYYLECALHELKGYVNNNKHELSFDTLEQILDEILKIVHPCSHNRSHIYSWTIKVIEFQEPKSDDNQSIQNSIAYKLLKKILDLCTQKQNIYQEQKPIEIQNLNTGDKHLNQITSRHKAYILIEQQDIQVYEQYKFNEQFILLNYFLKNFIKKLKDKPFQTLPPQQEIEPLFKSLENFIIQNLETLINSNLKFKSDYFLKELEQLCKLNPHHEKLSRPHILFDYYTFKMKIVEHPFFGYRMKEPVQNHYGLYKSLGLKKIAGGYLYDMPQNCLQMIIRIFKAFRNYKFQGTTKPILEKLLEFYIDKILSQQKLAQKMDPTKQSITEEGLFEQLFKFVYTETYFRKLLSFNQSSQFKMDTYFSLTYHFYKNISYYFTKHNVNELISVSSLLTNTGEKFYSFSQAIQQIHGHFKLQQQYQNKDIAQNTYRTLVKWNNVKLMHKQLQYYINELYSVTKSTKKTCYSNIMVNLIYQQDPTIYKQGLKYLNHTIQEQSLVYHKFMQSHLRYEPQDFLSQKEIAKSIYYHNESFRNTTFQNSLTQQITLIQSQLAKYEGENTLEKQQKNYMLQHLTSLQQENNFLKENYDQRTQEVLIQVVNTFLNNVINHGFICTPSELKNLIQIIITIFQFSQFRNDKPESYLQSCVQYFVQGVAKALLFVLKQFYNLNDKKQNQEEESEDDDDLINDDSMFKQQQQQEDYGTKTVKKTIDFLQRFVDITDNLLKDVTIDKPILQMVENLEKNIQTYPRINTLQTFQALIHLFNEGVFHIKERAVSKRYNNQDNTTLFSEYIFLDLIQFYTHNLSAGLSESISQINDVQEFILVVQFSYIIKQMEANYKHENLDEYIDYFTSIVSQLANITENMVTFLNSQSFKDFKSDNKQYVFIFVLSKCIQLIGISLEFIDQIPQFSQSNKLFKKLLALNKSVYKLQYWNSSQPLHNETIPRINKHLLKISRFLITHNKNNFIRSNIETKLKNCIFDEHERRFKYTITFDELFEYLDQEMILNHRCLIEVLVGLFEGFEENPETIKQLQEQYEQQLKQRKKQTQDGEDGEDGPENPEEDYNDQKQEEEKQQNNDDENKEGEEDDQDKEKSQKEGENDNDWHDLKSQATNKQSKKSNKKSKKHNKKKKKEENKEEKQESKQVLKLINIDRIHLCTSKVTKLTQSQHDALSVILEGKTPDGTNKASLSQQQYNQMIASLEFQVKQIKYFIQNWPLLVPYMLNYSFTIPQEIIENYTQLKQFKQLKFIDFLILFNRLSDFQFQQIIEDLCLYNYSFKIQQNQVILSKELFVQQLAQKLLYFLQKLFSRKDFDKNCNDLSILQGIGSILNLILKKKRYSQLLSMPTLKDVLVFTMTKFEQCNDIQSIEILEITNIIQALAHTVSNYFRANLRSLNTDKNSILSPDYKERKKTQLNYVHLASKVKKLINTKFFQFFDQEKIQEYQEISQKPFENLQEQLQNIQKLTLASTKMDVLPILSSLSPLDSNMSFSLTQTMHGQMNSITSQHEISTQKPELKYYDTGFKQLYYNNFTKFAYQDIEIAKNKQKYVNETSMTQYHKMKISDQIQQIQKSQINNVKNLDKLQRLEQIKDLKLGPEDEDEFKFKDSILTSESEKKIKFLIKDLFFDQKHTKEEINLKVQKKVKFGLIYRIEQDKQLGFDIKKSYIFLDDEQTQILKENNWIQEQKKEEEKKQEVEIKEPKVEEQDKEKEPEKEEEKKEEEDKKKDSKGFDFEEYGYKEEDLQNFKIDKEVFYSKPTVEKLEILKRKKEFVELKQKLEFVYLQETEQMNKRNRILKRRQHYPFQPSSNKEQEQKDAQENYEMISEFKEYIQSDKFEKLIKEYFKDESQRFQFLRFLDEDIVENLSEELKKLQKNAVKTIGKRKKYKDAVRDGGYLFYMDEYEDQYSSEGEDQSSRSRSRSRSRSSSRSRSRSRSSRSRSESWVSESEKSDKEGEENVLLDQIKQLEEKDKEKENDNDKKDQEENEENKDKPKEQDENQDKKKDEDKELKEQEQENEDQEKQVEQKQQDNKKEDEEENKDQDQEKEKDKQLEEEDENKSKKDNEDEENKEVNKSKKGNDDEEQKEEDENEDEEEEEEQEKEHSLDENDVESHGSQNSLNSFDSITYATEKEFDSFDEEEDPEFINKHKQMNEIIEKLDNNIEEILKLVPLFSDKFIYNILMYSHTEFCHKDIIFLKLLDSFFLNPYNSYRFIDALIFLQINNIHPKQAQVENNPLFDQPLFKYYKQKSSFTKELTECETTKKVQKSRQLLNLFRLVHSAHYNLLQLNLFDFPLHSQEQYSFQLDNNQKQIQTKFTTLNILNNYKFSSTFKALNTEKFSILQLNQMYVKWIAQLQQQSQNTQQQSIYLTTDNTEEKKDQNLLQESTGDLIKETEKFMKQIFRQIQFKDDLPSFSTKKYPRSIRPQKDQKYDFVIQLIQLNLEHYSSGEKRRLKDTDQWPMLKKITKTTQDFLHFSNIFLTSSTKKLKKQIHKAQQDFFTFQAKVKQEHQLENLNSAATSTYALYYQFEQLMVKQETFLTVDLKVFKKSIKDLIQLYKLAQKQELEALKLTYNKKLKECLDLQQKQKEEELKQPAQQKLRKPPSFQKKQTTPEDIVEQYQSEKRNLIEKSKTEILNAWNMANSQLISLSVDIIEYMYHCQNFCWSHNEEVPYVYANFQHAYKMVIILYEFLHDELQKQQADTNPNSIANFNLDQAAEEKSKQAQQQMAKQPSLLSRMMTKEQKIEASQLSRMMTKDNPKSLQTLSMQFSTMQESIHAIQQLKQNLDNINFHDLYEILSQRLFCYVAFFLTSEDVKSKKRWSKMINQIMVHPKDFKKLSSEMKVSQIQAIVKMEAQKKIKKKSPKYNLRFHINRDSIWYDTLAEITKYTGPQIALAKVTVTFKNEDGIDAGGLSREWIGLALKQILDPDVGLFTTTSNGVSLRINPNSNQIPCYLQHFEQVGKLIAKGLLLNLGIEVDLTLSMLKHILKKNLYIQDLEDIDPEEARNLHWVLENDVEGLDLTYSIDAMNFGELETIDLIENGSDTIITNENKKQFVKAVAYYKTTLQVKDQIEAFLKGFYSVVPYSAIQFFEIKEFGILLAGVKSINVNEMKKYTIFSGYTPDCQEIKWLFEILDEEDEENKALFLFFITGSFKVPYGGFKNLKIEITKMNNTDRLPVAHTCSKSLDLPPYESKEIMHEKLLISIQEGNKGFYIG